MKHEEEMKMLGEFNKFHKAFREYMEKRVKRESKQIDGKIEGNNVDSVVIDDPLYYSLQNTFPDENEAYYTIQPDGDIVKKVCEFDKEDLYNIAHSNYYASWQNAVRSRNQHVGIMQDVIRKIKESNKKERELKNG